MKNYAVESKQIYAEIIKYNLKRSYENAGIDFDVTSILMPKINEVIEALALGCVMSKPREFAGKSVTSADFQKIARAVDMEKIAVVVNALASAKSVKNRVFYILGTFIRSNGAVLREKNRTK